MGYYFDCFRMFILIHQNVIEKMFQKFIYFPQIVSWQSKIL